MLDEGSGAMEKKVPSRQSPALCKSNGATSERKSDFTPNRRGRGRRSAYSGGTKTQDGPQAPRPVPIQKWDRSFGDRRQRPRNSYDYRQREEVVENDPYDFVSTGSSRKVNANHLLNFKFCPRQSQLERHQWYSRGGSMNHGRAGYRKTRYKKEQFLQASCQFVVRDTGEYTEQAINSDALVDWSMVELVRSFSTEIVNCPICLQVPSAGKITKCGHTYCWACILHYLKLGQDESRKCPICYEVVELEDLKSVSIIDVPDFKVGDVLQLRLMRKSKGSVFTVPKDEWEDRQGKPMNIQDGPNTRYMKLLVASCDQIRTEVIEKERAALVEQLVDAEESETCFIQMALDLLTTRETSLKLVFQLSGIPKDKVYIPGLGSSHQALKVNDNIGKDMAADVIPTNSVTTVYADAFEDEVAEVLNDDNVEDDMSDLGSHVSEMTEAAASEAPESLDSHASDSFSSLVGSPPSPFPLLADQEVNPAPLSLEETAEQLELPVNLPQSGRPGSGRAHNLNTKDTYFFYQASTGQHIYLSSLNSQCLAREYATLEDSPSTVEGSIVAIERVFMTEDVRKRLRYLDHIPLTCEFHVVELKIKPPVVSKETLKFFEEGFERKRKLRQQKEREDKRRAKKYEMEHRKSLGLYPEVHIPLDNMKQFPSHLSASLEESGGDASYPTRELKEDVMYGNPRRSRNDSTTSDESLSGSMSFAQMLRAGKVTTPRSGGAWGRAPSSPSDLPDLAVANRPRQRGGGEDDEDSGGEACPAPSYSESMSDAIAKALDGINLGGQGQSTDKTTPAPNSGGGRKKRKEKKVLFSTAMARKS